MPDTYVIDASVAVKWFLPDEKDSAVARVLLARFVLGDVALVAPRNMAYECRGALCKAFQRCGKPLDELLVAFRDLSQLPIGFVDADDLLRRAAELAQSYRKSFYDMCYFALGEQNGLQVCTADEKAVSNLPSTFPCQFVLLSSLQ